MSHSIHIRNMAHPIYYVVDTLTVAVLSTCAAISAWLIFATASPADYEELKLLLLPLIGGMIVSGGMIMLNPTPETRKIVIGRAAIALFLASCAPQFCAILFPTWAIFLSHPIILFGAGGVLSIFFYALSRPFAEGIYQRSRTLSNIALNEVERVARIQRKDDVREAVTDAVNGSMTDAMDGASKEAQKVARAVIATAAPVAKEIVAEAARVAAEKLNQEKT